MVAVGVRAVVVGVGVAVRGCPVARRVGVVVGVAVVRVAASGVGVALGVAEGRVVAVGVADGARGVPRAGVMEATGVCNPLSSVAITFLPTA